MNLFRRLYVTVTEILFLVLNEPIVDFTKDLTVQQFYGKKRKYFWKVLFWCSILERETRFLRTLHLETLSNFLWSFLVISFIWWIKIYCFFCKAIKSLLSADCGIIYFCFNPCHLLARPTVSFFLASVRYTASVQWRLLLHKTALCELPTYSSVNACVNIIDEVKAVIYKASPDFKICANYLDVGRASTPLEINEKTSRQKPDFVLNFVSDRRFWFELQRNCSGMQFIVPSWNCSNSSHLTHGQMYSRS